MNKETDGLDEKNWAKIAKAILHSSVEDREDLYYKVHSGLRHVRLKDITAAQVPVANRPQLAAREGRETFFPSIDKSNAGRISPRS